MPVVVNSSCDQTVVEIYTCPAPAADVLYVGENLGAGAGVYESTDQEAQPRVHKFKSLVEGTGITITEDADEITISGATQFAVDNVGTGAQVHRDTTLDTAHLRSVIAGAGIKVEQLADEIKVSSLAGTLGTFDLSTVAHADLACGSTQTINTYANLANLAVGDLMVWVMVVDPGSWTGGNDCMQLPVGWQPYVTPKYSANDYFHFTTAIAYRFATAADLDPLTSYTVTMTRSGQVCGRVLAYRGANQHYPLGAMTSMYPPGTTMFSAPPAPGDAENQPLITMHQIFDQTGPGSVPSFPVPSNQVGPTIDTFMDVHQSWTGFATNNVRISSTTASVKDDENAIAGESYLASLGATGWTAFQISARTRGGPENQYTVFSALTSNGRHYIERQVDLVAGQKYTFHFQFNRSNWNSTVANQCMGISYVDPSNNERGFPDNDTGMGTKLDPLSDHGTVWFANIFPGVAGGVPSDLGSVACIHFTAQANGLHKIRISAVDSGSNWSFTGSGGEGWRVQKVLFRSGWRWPADVYTDSNGITAGSAMRMLHAPGWLSTTTPTSGHISRSIPVVPDGLLTAIKMFPYSQRSDSSIFGNASLKTDRTSIAYVAGMGRSPSPTYGPTRPVYPVYAGQRRKYYFEWTALAAGNGPTMYIAPIGAPYSNIGQANPGVLWTTESNQVFDTTAGHGLAAGVSDFAINDVVGCSLDFTSGTSAVIKFYKNGVNVWTSTIAQDAATTQWHPDEPWTMWLSSRHFAGVGVGIPWRVNFGGDAAFAYQPAGFEPWDIGYVPSTPTASSQGDLVVGTGAGSSEILPAGAAGQELIVNPNTTTGLQWIDRPPRFRGAAFVSDSGLTAIVPHVALHMSQACTIKRVLVLGDTTGSAVVAIGKVSLSTYTGAAGANICGADPPTLSGVSKLDKISFTGWDLNVAIDDILTIKLSSVSGFARLSVLIYFGDPA